MNCLLQKCAHEVCVSVDNILELYMWALAGTQHDRRGDIIVAIIKAKTSPCSVN